MPAEYLHNRSRVIPFRVRRRLRHLVACSVCLRVRERELRLRRRSDADELAA